MEPTLIKEFSNFCYGSIRRNQFGRIKSFLWLISFKLTNIFVRLGANRRVRFLDGKKIFNVGCGSDIIKGTISFDTFDRLDRIHTSIAFRKQNRIHPINILVADKYLTSTADGILLNHVLEHLNPIDVVDALKVLKATLVDGGTLRISVPNYQCYTNDKVQKSPQGYEHNIISLNSLFYSWGHKLMYSEQLLIDLLQYAEFSKVEICKHGEGELGSFDSEHRRFESIYVEARK